MLVDLTLEITPEMAAQHGMHAGKLPGHLGTHFDVMNKTFPLDYTTREAIVFDVSSIKDREIEPEDIDLSLIHADMFVGFRTGFIEEHGYGTDTYRHDHPQLSMRLVDELLKKHISIIGIDFAGIRRGKEHTPADQYCADHGVFIVENLVGLDRVIGHSVIHTYPMRYSGITGLPCRVIAETE